MSEGTVAEELRPAGYLRLSLDGVETMTYPLFRKPELIRLERELPALRFDWDGAVLLVCRDDGDGAPATLGGARIDATPRLVRAGERLQCGVVSVELEVYLLDGDITRTVASGGSWRLRAATPSAPRGDDATNVIRLERCFRPPRNAAGSREETRPWSLDDARREPPDVLARLSPRRLWRGWQRRPKTPRHRSARAPLRLIRIVSALLMLLTLAFSVVIMRSRGPQRAPRRAPAPVAAARVEPVAPPRAPAIAPLSDAAAATELKAGIVAYREGRIAEATRAFGVLAADPREANAARLMLWVLARPRRSE